MADMTGILSHICSTGENGKSLGKRAQNAPSLKKVDVWFLFSFLAKKDIEQCSVSRGRLYCQNIKIKEILIPVHSLCEVYSRATARAEKSFLVRRL